MFTRSLFAAVGTLVAAGALAVAPASATDEPTPPKPVPPSQGRPVAPKACVDTFRPRTRLAATWRRGFRTGVIRGMAIDEGCGAAGAGAVKHVSVAVERKVGKRCQHLLRNGRLGRAGACSTHVWLPAKGTKTWSFKLRHKLPNGRYLVSSRAVDGAGNVEARARR
jgi:hypothetical protein